MRFWLIGQTGRIGAGVQELNPDLSWLTRTREPGCVRHSPQPGNCCRVQWNSYDEDVTEHADGKGRVSNAI